MVSYMIFAKLYLLITLMGSGVFIYFHGKFEYLKDLRISKQYFNNRPVSTVNWFIYKSIALVFIGASIIILIDVLCSSIC